MKLKGITLRDGLALRACLVPFAVGACYLSDWHWLRELTAYLTIRATGWFGVPWTQIGPELGEFHGRTYSFVVACTMADAWCGAIPLVWKTKTSVLRNAAYVGFLAAWMFVLNVARLTISHLLFAAGFSWFIAHKGVAALAYLLVWMRIQRREAWQATVAEGPQFVLRPKTTSSVASRGEIATSPR